MLTRRVLAPVAAGALAMLYLAALLGRALPILTGQ
jgi:hypothetical protein